uniref:ATP synthase subunit a n=1 Tax=Encyrtus eulecaniumiae TaxID=1914888 RepID=A0A7S5KNP1_9HYME|nr:ATP synthase F0 subunit 6 [Encyrtus eulecaniumiae]
MMMNLFSVFDPSSSVSWSLNWVSSLYVFIFIPMVYWFSPSRLNYLMLIPLKILESNFKDLLEKKVNLVNLLLFLSLLVMIFFNNFFGLFPYIFTSSSHLIFSLSLALILWLSFMIYGWNNHTNHMFAHLVPQGTPGVLMSFMVLVESLSNSIRAGTLSVRLSANMVAGHLLMTLISSTGPSLSLFFLVFMLVGQSVLIILELSVSLIQAYVFSVLSTLYSAEVN